jgi:anti-sigma-K factor RskA
MKNQNKLLKLEAMFDASPADPALEGAATDSECAEWLHHLRMLHAHGERVQQATPVIEDAQFNAFFAGIQDGMQESAPAGVFRRGWWAIASLSAAAVLVAFSAFWMMTEGPQPVNAEVEAASTEVEGATVECYDTEQGVPTVWVTLAEDDLL